MTDLPNGLSNLATGQISVSESAQQLPESLASLVVLTALSTNTNPVFIGPNGVATSTGLELAAGQSITLPIANAAMIFVVSSAADGNTLSWAAMY